MAFIRVMMYKCVSVVRCKSNRSDRMCSKYIWFSYLAYTPLHICNTCCAIHIITLCDLAFCKSYFLVFRAAGCKIVVRRLELEDSAQVATQHTSLWSSIRRSERTPIIEYTVTSTHKLEVFWSFGAMLLNCLNTWNTEVYANAEAAYAANIPVSDSYWTVYVNAPPWYRGYTSTVSHCSMISKYFANKRALFLVARCIFTFGCSRTRTKFSNKY